MYDKILAIVVTYFPDEELLRKNISAFIDDVDKVLIWENTPENEKHQYRFIKNPKIEYHGDGVNNISHALNYGWRYAKDHHYDYLLTMDQDSLLENFRSYLQCTVYGNPPEGMWCPQINSEHNSELYQLRDSTITSGLLAPVRLLDKAGGWNEFFAIDSVDTEFFSRIKFKGIPLYGIGSCRLIQKFGDPKTVKFLGKSFELRNDSPERLYYIYRNYVIVMRMYPSKTLRIGFQKVWLRKIKWILFFEEKGFKKACAIFKGIKDGFRHDLRSVSLCTQL